MGCALLRIGRAKCRLQLLQHHPLTTPHTKGPESKAHIQHEVARFVIGSGSPLRVVELDTFADMIKKVGRLQGAVKIPSRSYVSKTLLADVYSEVKQSCTERIEANRSEGFPLYLMGGKTVAGRPS